MTPSLPPLTDEQLAEIRDWLEGCKGAERAEIPAHLRRYETWLGEADGRAILLLAEVDRLRSELAATAHSLKLSERGRRATLAGCCVMLGMPKDTAEPDVFEAIRRLRLEPARPSAGHSAVYIDQRNQSVWSDYPTVPPGDDVLPMVWASEQAQSRGDLAERGVELRVVGWIK